MVYVPGWKAGDLCEAQWTEDDVWYQARIEAISEDGRYANVTFPEYENSDVVTFDRVRPLPGRTAPAPVAIPASVAAAASTVPAADLPKWRVGTSTPTPRSCPHPRLCR